MYTITSHSEQPLILKSRTPRHYYLLSARLTLGRTSLVFRSMGPVGLIWRGWKSPRGLQDTCSRFESGKKGAAWLVLVEHMKNPDTFVARASKPVGCSRHAMQDLVQHIAPCRRAHPLSHEEMSKMRGRIPYQPRHLVDAGPRLPMQLFQVGFRGEVCGGGCRSAVITALVRETPRPMIVARSDFRPFGGSYPLYLRNSGRTLSLTTEPWT